MSEAHSAARESRDSVETELQVLKNEITSFHRSMDAFSAKIDLVMSMQIQLVRIQERQDTTQHALERAFAEIKSLREETVKTLREDVDEVTGDFDQASGMFRSALVIGAVLFAAIQWFVLRQLDLYDDTARQVDELESRMTTEELTLRNHIELTKGRQVDSRAPQNLLQQAIESQE